MILEDLVFVGLNGRVLAIDRNSGALIWEWASPKRGYVSVLVDGDRVLAAVNGYLFCLDPAGRLIWENPLKGYGLGVTCLATVRGSTIDTDRIECDNQARQRQSAASAAPP